MFLPSRFGREGFEASDELVCTCHRLFEVLVLLWLEVVHFFLEVVQGLCGVIQHTQFIDNVFEGFSFFVHDAEVFGYVSSEDDTEDCFVVVLV